MARLLDFSDGFESSVQPTASPVAASEISNTPSGNLSATTIQGAVNELQGDIDVINASKGANDGIATLDSNGKVPTTQMPALAITEVFVVADIAARDALTVEEGDVAKVLDDGSGNQMVYMYTGTVWTDLSSDGQLAIHEADTSAHGVSGNVVGTTDTQVITNKDIDGGAASNANRITLPKALKATLDGLTRKEGTILYGTDTVKAYVDNGSALVPIGSGSGGTLNYIANHDAETDTSGWATYKNTAGTAPTTGTGGSPTFDFTRTTSSPLRGLASFLITKAASNQQGEGASYDFTIDRADQAKQLSISFDYEVASGTYATGDLGVYIVDVTNGTVIQPSGFQVVSVGGQGTHTSCVFQTASNSTSFRLCFHVATSTATAYTMRVDNVSAGPQVVPVGYAATEWNSYVPTLTSSGGGAVTLNATSAVQPWGYYRQDGDSWEVNFGLRNGSGGAASGSAGFIKFSLPPGVSRLSNGSSPTDGVVGAYLGPAHTSSGTTPAGVYDIYSDNTLSVGDGSGSAVSVSEVIAGYSISASSKFKGTGISSNTIVSDSAASRRVGFNSTGIPTAPLVNGSFVNVTFPATTNDDVGGYNSGTGTYTVKVPGAYDISFTGSLTGTFPLSGGMFIGLKINGVVGNYRYCEVSGGTGSLSGNTNALNIKLNADDTIVPVIQTTGWSGVAMNADPNTHNFSIAMRQGPAQIQAATIVSARYIGNPPTGTLNASVNLVTYPTRDDDTTGMVSSGSATIPAPGRYDIKAGFGISFSSSTANQYIAIYIRKNGVIVKAKIVRLPASVLDYSVEVADTLNLVTGDIITIASQTSVTSPVFLGVEYNVFSITRMSGVN